MKALQRTQLLRLPSRCFNSSHTLANKDNYYKRRSESEQVEEKPEGWDVAKPFGTIPGPRPLPLVGNTWRYLTGELNLLDFLGVFKKMHAQYGDMCAIREMIIPDIIMVFDPTEIEKVFRNEGIWPVREGFESLRYYRNVIRHDVFGDTGSVVNTNGAEWFRIRSTVNPILMQPRTAQNYTDQLNEVSTDFIEKLKRLTKDSPNGEMPENFDNEINKWAFESIGVIALDKRLGCLKDPMNPETQQMIQYMISLFQMMMVLDFTPLGKYMIKYNLPLWRKFVKYQDHFTDMCLKLINDTEERIRHTEEYQKKDGHEKSVFEKLLEADKKIAMTMTLDMLTAGIDTTGKTTCATLYYLAKNRNVQKKLRDELRKVMPTPDSPVTKEMLTNVPYLKAVIKEIGRLAPIAPASVRKMTKDLVIGGYQIPKGATLYAPTLYLSRQDKYYPQAKEFIPERWLRETEGDLSYKNSNPFATLHFGFGPRSCVGKRFANLEMEIIISKIIRNFELEWHHPEMRFEQHLIYAIKDPLKLQLKQINY